MWKFNRDKTQPVVTAKQHVESKHGGTAEKLPETAVLFYMHGFECITQNYPCSVVMERLPRFTKSCPVYKFNSAPICFMDGGLGAPQAADTLETLAVLGVKNVISIGLCGAFSNKVSIGETVAVSKALVEEGTSLHYYKRLKSATPSSELLQRIDNLKHVTIVSSDSFYRQTYFKEKLWRKKGAVGVDMETSALYSVGKYLGLNVVSLLTVSDIHPLSPSDQHWQWILTQEMRENVFKNAVETAMKLAKN